jgi:antitoxin ParD1/3/4
MSSRSGRRSLPVGATRTSEVVRDALRLMEERERRLAAFDAAIGRGIADIDSGRVHDADAVFDEFEARYTRMAQEREEI